MSSIEKELKEKSERPATDVGNGRHDNTGYCLSINHKDPWAHSFGHGSSCYEGNTGVNELQNQHSYDRLVVLPATHLS